MSCLPVSLLLFITLVGSCHKNADIGPDVSFQRRWHLLQARDANDESWIKYYPGIYADTEYRADGALIYREDGLVVPTPCCSVSRYEVSNGVIIRYADQSGCPSVRCAGLTDGAIQILRDDLLEIRVGNRIMQYEPVK